MMREYELILIFNPELASGEVKKVVAKITGWIKPKGKVIKQDEWGEKKLSYPIKIGPGGKMIQSANFIQIDFGVSADLALEIGKNLESEEEVIRFLIVKKKPIGGGGKVNGKKSK